MMEENDPALMTAKQAAVNAIENADKLKKDLKNVAILDTWIRIKKAVECGGGYCKVNLSRSNKEEDEAIRYFERLGYIYSDYMRYAEQYPLLNWSKEAIEMVSREQDWYLKNPIPSQTYKQSFFQRLKFL